ncbi:hypothetical protein [Streptosporangium amethystogenes]|uniref:hypothetical protein n=1 Tax=Streptosporangium amethystogenes TaxID=2002 RepID=UPI0012FA8E53|nr:hypothetical protein [Streptosporangium amethystogenes]
MQRVGQPHLVAPLSPALGFGVMLGLVTLAGVNAERHQRGHQLVHRGRLFGARRGGHGAHRSPCAAAVRA